MNGVWIGGLFMLFFLIGSVAVTLYVQIKLSSKPNKYLGWILPGISFLLSLLMLLGWYSFRFETGTITESYTILDEQTGEEIEGPEQFVEIIEIDPMTSVDYLTLGASFLLINIPTILLIGVYRSERNSQIDQKN